MLVTVVLVAMILPFYALLKAMQADIHLFREGWAKTPPRARRLQWLALVIWLVTLVVAFGIGFAVTRNVVVAGGTAFGWATVLAVVGPFVAASAGKRSARRRGSGSPGSPTGSPPPAS